MAILGRFLAVLLLSSAVYGASQQVSVNSFQYLDNSQSSLVIDDNAAQDLLNVDITRGGKSVKKRDGYGSYKSLTAGTAIHGGHHLFDATGNDVQIWASSTSLWGIVNDGTPTQLISSGTLNATWDCSDTQGSAYCVSTSRDALIKTDGATKSWYTTPLGTMVEVTPTRLAIAGVSGAANSIYFSRDSSFTDFSTGVSAADPFIEVIAAPGGKLTHLRYACNRLLWWKDQSFGYVQGDTQSDIQVSIVSDTIGTFDNSSAIDPDGRVWFRAQDGRIYSYDCAMLTDQSREISQSIQSSGRRSSNLMQVTTQTEFEAGSIAANGAANGLSTTISPANLVPSSYTILDSTNTDFAQGTVPATIDTTTISGAFALKAYAAEDFSSLSEWTNESNSFTTANFSVSGGEGRCIGRCQMTLTATPNPSGDFVVSFTKRESGLPTNGAFFVGMLDSSGNAGYMFMVESNVMGIKETTDFAALAPVVTGSSVSSISPTGTDTFTFSRNNTTGDMKGYFNGNLRVTYTDATYSTLAHIKVKSEAGASSFFDTFYVGARLGSFTSRTFDTLFSTPIYGTFGADTSGSGTIALSYRCSAASGSGYISDTSITSGSRVSACTNKRYFVYSSTLTAAETGAASLPTISSVTVPVSSTGTYYSIVRNAPSLSSFDTFTANDAANNGTLTYYIRSSTSLFTALSSTPSWVSQTKNAVVAASSGTYFQARIDFTIDAATQTPTVNDFTINWFEGNAADKAYAIYFDNAIWWTIAFGSGQSTNNYVFKYDLINNGWTLYDFGAGGFLTQNARLYFGSPSSGALYRYGSSTSDNGSAITTRWKSKDFTGPDPWLDNEYKNLDVYALRNTNQSLTVTYSIGTSTSTTSFSVPLSSTTSSIISYRKLLPVGKVGNTINVQVGDSSASSAWEFLGFRATFDPLAYRPTQ